MIKKQQILKRMKKTRERRNREVRKGEKERKKERVTKTEKQRKRGR
jgi:hypothetical protein